MSGAKSGAKSRTKSRAKSRAKSGTKSRTWSGNRVWDRVWHQVWDQFWVQVWSQVWDQDWDQVWDQYWDRVWDHTWSIGVLSFYDYLSQVLGLVEETKPLAGMIQATQNSGWWIPCRDVCYICDHPNRILRDDQGRLHCSDGPAFSYL
jgi:hypothetical protein